jgi:hypothetical protein
MIISALARLAVSSLVRCPSHQRPAVETQCSCAAWSGPAHLRVTMVGLTSGSRAATPVVTNSDKSLIAPIVASLEG